MSSSNRTNPVPAGEYEISTLYAVRVSGNYAFLAGAGGLQILDISDPMLPVPVGGFFKAGVVWDVQIVDQRAYLGDSFPGFSVLDISDPTQPALLGTFNTGGGGRVRVEGNYAYVTSLFSNLDVIDVSDPTRPSRVGRFTNNRNINGFDVHGNYAYLAQNSGLAVVQLRDGAPQTIIFDLPNSMPLSAGSLPLVATSSSGLPVTFKVLSGPAQLVGDKLQFTGTGRVLVEAEQAGAGEVLPATLVRAVDIVHPNLVAWGDRKFKTATMAASVPERITAMASGSHHCLVLDENGSITAWGGNRWGETQVPSAAISNTVDLAAGFGHSLAVTRDGRVLAWGQNWFGQTDVPAAATNVVAVSAGYSHSVCLRADGTVLAWGDNDYLQSEVPLEAKDVVAIDCGYFHTLALRADGRVVSWGINLTARDEDSQRELAVQFEETVPDSATNVVGISAGWAHNLAIRQDGSVLAWGDNSSGQSDVPAAVTNVVAVAAGFYHSAALGADGKVMAWGRDAFGGVSDAREITNALAIAVGEDYSAAVLGKGPYSIGVPLQEVRTTPGGMAVLQVPIFGAALSFQWYHNGEAVASATNRTLVVQNATLQDVGSYTLRVKAGELSTDSAVIELVVADKPANWAGAEAWGDDNAGQCDLPPSLTAPRAIAAGNFHGLALDMDGRVLGWGKNADGQISIPASVTNAVAIAAGGNHSMALTSDGRVLAWGRNWDGQTEVPDSARGVTRISAGWGHCLALKADGTVLAWGNNDYDQCSVPADLQKVIDISAGYYHSLALCANGRVVSWGEIGDVPADLPPAVTVAAGWRHSLALTRDGLVLAWGENDYGECIVPSSATNVVAIAAGYGFSMALRSDGTLLAWGKNFYGESKVPGSLPKVTAIAAGEDFSLALVEQGPPLITRQPQPVLAKAGDDALFTVGAFGSGPMSFQWNWEGHPLDGATNSFLFFDGLGSSTAGQYSVTITNPFGETETGFANLDVLPEPVRVPSLTLVSTALDAESVRLVVAVRGEQGAQLVVETGTDLQQWTEVEQVAGTGAGNPLTVALTSTADSSFRFWRVRPR